MEDQKLTKNQENYIKLKDYYQKYRDDHKEQQKQYNDKNKDLMKDYYKNRYLVMKEKMLNKIKCDCGSFVCSSAMKRHIKTAKHNLIISQIEIAKNETLQKIL